MIFVDLLLLPREVLKNKNVFLVILQPICHWIRLSNDSIVKLYVALRFFSSTWPTWSTWATCCYVMLCYAPQDHDKINKYITEAGRGISSARVRVRYLDI